MIFITISFLVIAALGTPNEAENARLLQTNRALRQALQELQVGVDEEQVGNGESAVAVQVSEEASVGAVFDCSGGKANSNGRGGDNCSGLGNNNVPWCYVGTNSGCNDLQGDTWNPWSEEACALPLRQEERATRKLQKATAKSTCGGLTPYKKCSGRKQLISFWSRIQPGGSLITQMTSSSGNDSGEGTCKLMCENMGIQGCCEYQWDHQECYFTPFASSTESDSGYVDKWNSSEREMERKVLRYGSVCSVPNCVYEMQTLIGRRMECGFNNKDRAGRSSLGGNRHSMEACMNSCLNELNCMFASLSSTGYCHKFQTCNGKPGGSGWTTGQKICRGTIEYDNSPWCEGNNCI